MVLATSPEKKEALKAAALWGPNRPQRIRGCTNFPTRADQPPVQGLRRSAGQLQCVPANACGEVTLPVLREIKIGRLASRRDGVNGANHDLKSAAVGKQGARVAGGLGLVERFAPEAQAVFLGVGLGCKQRLGAWRRDFRCQGDAGLT